MNVTYSLTSSMVIFTVITIIYAVVKTMMSPNTPSEKYSNKSDSAILMAYALIFFISQIVINAINSSAACNNTKQPFLPIFLYTLFPFFFIFGSIILMLQIYKGWLNPFSNTIGYLIAMIMGKGSEAFTKIIATNNLKGDIIDESWNTNEINKENYVDFMNKLHKKGGTEEPFPNVNPTSAYNKLYKMVILKDTIAECVWYLLAGCLTISITNNIIVNVQCDYDVKTMATIKKKADDTSKKSKKPVLLQRKLF